MVKILKREIIKCFQIDKKKILTIAEVENKTAKRLIYYLSFLSGKREDRKHRINKKTYDLEKQTGTFIKTQTL